MKSSAYGFPRKQPTMAAAYPRKPAELFNPTLYSNCNAWIKSSDLDPQSTYVESWPNRIGGSFTKSVSNTIGKPPIYTTGWRGFPAAWFWFSLLNTGITGPTGTGNRTFAIVASHVYPLVASSAFSYLFAYGSPGPNGALYSLSAHPTLGYKLACWNHDLTPGIMMSQSGLDVVIIGNSGTSAYINVNGTHYTGTLGSMNTASTYPILLGCRPPEINDASGAFWYEFAYWSSAFTSGEVSEMSTLLRTQYEWSS